MAAQNNTINNKQNAAGSGLSTIAAPAQVSTLRPPLKRAKSGQPCPITKQDYDFLAADAMSVCQGGVVAANASLADDVAYDLAKAMITQIGKYQAGHRVFAASVTPAKVVEPASTPFHPGALKYYREAGLIK